MPLYKEHLINPHLKVLIAAESGNGKTSLLATLLKANYRVAVIDVDNGLDILSSYCPPDLYNNLFFATYDKADPLTITKAKGLIKNWVTPQENLGPPAKWGLNSVIVIDTLTSLGDSSLKSAQRSPQEGRHEYQVAQDSLSEILDILLSPTYETNVLINTHLSLIEDATGLKKLYPTAVGKALSRVMARDFNNVWRIDVKPGNDTRVIRTQSDHLMALKSSAPSILAKEEVFDLGDIFKRVLKHNQDLAAAISARISTPLKSSA